jgi:uncharacterized protein YecE (DUF72 family)
MRDKFDLISQPSVRIKISTSELLDKNGEMLRHYNIAVVMTDSPPSENLQFLSDFIITANQSFIRFHGRNTKGHYWYNYLYSEQELKPAIEEVNQIREKTKILRIYFNNHYGGNALLNAMRLG